VRHCSRSFWTLDVCLAFCKIHSGLKALSTLAASILLPEKNAIRLQQLRSAFQELDPSRFAALAQFVTIRAANAALHSRAGS
jgi:hypothetical protein